MAEVGKDRERNLPKSPRISLGLLLLCQLGTGKKI